MTLPKILFGTDPQDGTKYCVFFKGDGSFTDKKKSQYFHKWYSHLFAGKKIKTHYTYGNYDGTLTAPLQFYQLYKYYDLSSIIDGYKNPEAAAKAAKTKAEAEAAAAAEKAAKEAAIEEWKTREYPVTGDWLLLLFDGKPCEDFTFIEQLLETTAQGTFIVTDSYNRTYEVKPEFERNHIPPVKFFRVVTEVMVADTVSHEVA